MGRGRILFLVSLLSLMILPAVVGAGKSDFDDMVAADEIGRGLGSQIGSVLGGVAQLRASAAQTSAEIEAARRAYWQAVRTGKNVKAAKARFAAKLWEKDVVYLTLAIPEGLQGPRSRFAQLISGGIDGGIRPAAQGRFANWVTKIRIELGADPATGPRGSRMVIPGPAQLEKALKAAERPEKAYIHARDWAERDISGLTFPWDTDARAHAMMILTRYSPLKPGEKATDEFRKLADVFGEQEVLRAAERLRTAPRNAKAKLANPAALGIHSADPLPALNELLGASSDRGYSLYVMCLGDRFSPVEARQEYDRFVWVYGAEAVDSAARFVRDLPRNGDGFLDLDDSPIKLSAEAERIRVSWNPPRVGLYRAFWSVLNLRHPEDRIPAMFAFYPEVKSKNDADHLRQSLERRYGEQAVADAARALDVFWRGGDPRLSYDDRNRIWMRRKELREEAYRIANRSPGSFSAHLYEADYPILLRILDQGAVKVLGELGQLPTTEGSSGQKRRLSGGAKSEGAVMSK